jgi:hypothetical protein
MDISNLHSFDGLKDLTVPEELQPFLRELIGRLDSFRNDLIRQLNSKSTIYYADPDNEPEKITGYKAGDIAVWVDSTGASNLRVLE